MSRTTDPLGVCGKWRNRFDGREVLVYSSGDRTETGATLVRASCLEPGVRHYGLAMLETTLRERWEPVS
jgi:hypothetical protein